MDKTFPHHPPEAVSFNPKHTHGKRLRLYVVLPTSGSPYNTATGVPLFSSTNDFY